MVAKFRLRKGLLLEKFDYIYAKDIGYPIECVYSRNMNALFDF